MSASFFQKFRPPGSTPIVSEKRVVKTKSSTATTATKSTTTTTTKRVTTTTSSPAAAAAAAAAAADARRPRKLSHVPPEAHPRHVHSAVTLAVSDTRPSTAAVPPKRDLETARSSPNLKRGLDQVRPPQNLKRSASAVHHRESTKPPSPDAIPHHVQRSSVSSRSPRSQRLESSDEESSEDERISKRSKIGSSSPRGPAPDATRRLVHPISFRTKDPKTGQPLERCKFIHAETIAGLGQPGWSRRKEFKNAATQDDFSIRVGLHYPGIPDQERYQLVENSDPDEFKPVIEMLETMELVAAHLLPPSLAASVHSEESGTMVYRMRRGLKDGDYPKFMENLKAYNTLIRQSRRDGTFKKRISSMTSIPFPLVEHILGQSYARTVALEVEGLKNYQAFTSEVYGELLPKLTTKIFREANLTSDKVFVDLGSGTGNVVLHAALECGCESWGCEKMDKPAQLAEKQREEFIARCRMWGINHGSVHLEHDTFLENRNIADALKRADVLLVNNFAFEPGLNQKLLDMFLDLKEGALIFSLKPFVPANHIITTRNAENPVNRLRMVEKEYFSREVSWTDSGGKYYVHTVDSTMLRDFFEKEGRRRERS